MKSKIKYAVDNQDYTYFYNVDLFYEFTDLGVCILDKSPALENLNLCCDLLKLGFKMDYDNVVKYIVQSKLIFNIEICKVIKENIRETKYFSNCIGVYGLKKVITKFYKHEDFFGELLVKYLCQKKDYKAFMIEIGLTDYELAKVKDEKILDKIYKHGEKLRSYKFPYYIIPRRMFFCFIKDVFYNEYAVSLIRNAGALREYYVSLMLYVPYAPCFIDIFKEEDKIKELISEDFDYLCMETLDNSRIVPRELVESNSIKITQYNLGVLLFDLELLKNFYKSFTRYEMNFSATEIQYAVELGLTKEKFITSQYSRNTLYDLIFSTYTTDVITECNKKFINSDEDWEKLVIGYGLFSAIINYENEKDFKVQELKKLNSKLSKSELITNTLNIKTFNYAKLYSDYFVEIKDLVKNKINCIAYLRQHFPIKD